VASSGRVARLAARSPATAAMLCWWTCSSGTASSTRSASTPPRRAPGRAAWCLSPVRRVWARPRCWRRCATGCQMRRWLWGACDGSFTPQPLGPLFAVAAQLGGALEQACHGDGSKHRLFRLLLEELRSSTGLTVLAVADVHGADDATLDLLRFQSRRLRGTRTLLIATYRDDGPAPDHPLRVAIGELSSHRSTRRVSLPPLSRRRGHVGTWLRDRAGGDPSTNTNRRKPVL